MYKLKGPAKYSARVNNKFIVFSTIGTYETNDKEIVNVLSKVNGITVEGDNKLSDRNIKEPKEPTIQELYKEKFKKDVPVNKKNDVEWIKNKLAE